MSTCILCIDVWDKHTCKTNNLVKKLKIFLKKCNQNNIQIIHMHDLILKEKHSYLYEKKPNEETQQKYLNYGVRQPDISDHIRKLYYGDINIDEKNVEYPICAKSAFCECDYERSCFLENNPILKEDMDLYFKLNRKVIDINNYCTEKFNGPFFNMEDIYLHPDLVLFKNDVYLDHIYELYAYLHENNIKNIVYVGGCGNQCISWSRQYSMYHMKKIGFNTFFIKDLIINISGNGFNPDSNLINNYYTNDYFDKKIFETLDKYYGKSISQDDVIKL